MINLNSGGIEELLVHIKSSIWMDEVGNFCLSRETLSAL